MRCEQCGFDADLWSDAHLASTLSGGPALVRATRFRAPEHVLQLLPRGPLPGPGTPEPETVHELMHRLHVAGRARHTTTPTTTGHVVQLNRSKGGVPKTPVEAVRITRRGLEGDVQKETRIHGRPWQAVCLWAAEVVDAHAGAGHPIGYGCAGENVTVRGLDWSLMTPGAQVQVGEALLQLTAFATPCRKNARWFSDGGFHRLSHEVDPLGSRLYASVLREGCAAAGSPVVLEPGNG